MNNKIVEMSHNVCYRRDNLRFRLGDIVIWLDDPYVVVSVLLDADKNRYVLRDSEGGEILVYEYEIQPYFEVGDIVREVKPCGVDFDWRVVKFARGRVYCFPLEVGMMPMSIVAFKPSDIVLKEKK